MRSQILAHDGFSTASSTTEAIELPAKAPAVTILYPTTDDVVYAERHLHLWGAATSFSGAQIPDESFTRLIDGHEVGHGRDLWVESPEPGSHEVRLAVSDEAGLAVGDVQSAPASRADVGHGESRGRRLEAHFVW